MTEPERDSFLAPILVEHGKTLVGFSVLGGICGEGIDLQPATVRHQPPRSSR